MNPLAQNLNNELYQYNPEVLSMLSQLGKEMFYPKVFFPNQQMPSLQNIMQQ